jgi:hypothetical protein
MPGDLSTIGNSLHTQRLSVWRMRRRLNVLQVSEYGTRAKQTVNAPRDFDAYRASASHAHAETQSHQ